jgi:hypothetical protein
MASSAKFALNAPFKDIKSLDAALRAVERAAYQSNPSIPMPVNIPVKALGGVIRWPSRL